MAAGKMLVKIPMPNNASTTFIIGDIGCGNLLPQCEHFFALGSTSAKH